jgi:hypothetical protein
MRKSVVAQAAAVAFVGWYLMTPPTNEHDNSDPRLPLHQGWNIYGRFDTASECQSARLGEIVKTSVQLEKSKRGGLLESALLAEGESLMASRCIATDDPRLKGN